MEEEPNFTEQGWTGNVSFTVGFLHRDNSYQSVNWFLMSNYRLKDPKVLLDSSLYLSHSHSLYRLQKLRAHSK